MICLFIYLLSYVVDVVFQKIFGSYQFQNYLNNYIFKQWNPKMNN